MLSYNICRSDRVSPQKQHIVKSKHRSPAHSPAVYQRRVRFEPVVDREEAPQLTQTSTRSPCASSIAAASSSIAAAASSVSRSPVVHLLGPILRAIWNPGLLTVLLPLLWCATCQFGLDTATFLSSLVSSSRTAAHVAAVCALLRALLLAWCPILGHRCGGVPVAVRRLVVLLPIAHLLQGQTGSELGLSCTHSWKRRLRHCALRVFGFGEA